LFAIVHERGGFAAKMPDLKEDFMADTHRTELEAAAFRQLLAHLQQHTEVQNIELMILADFCRNCLAKWYAAAAAERGIDVDYEQAREIVYGMPYGEWKEKYQREATPEQLAAYQARQKLKEKT
jgi:hypothetical protein